METVDGGKSYTASRTRQVVHRKSHTAHTLANELQLQLRVASELGPVNTATQDHHAESVHFRTPQTAGLASFYIPSDDMLSEPELPSALLCKTGIGQIEWYPDFKRPTSVLQFVGLGQGSTHTIHWVGLLNLLNLPNRLFLPERLGMVGFRRCHCVCLHSRALTNYKCVGTAVSRTCLAEISNSFLEPLLYWRVPTLHLCVTTRTVEALLLAR